jgi:hypothetical protein
MTIEPSTLTDETRTCGDCDVESVVDVEVFFTRYDATEEWTCPEQSCQFVNTRDATGEHGPDPDTYHDRLSEGFYHE